MLDGHKHQGVPVLFGELSSQEHCFSGKAWYEGLEVVNWAYEGLKFDLGIASGKVLEGLDLGGIWPHALCGE